MFYRKANFLFIILITFFLLAFFTACGVKKVSPTPTLKAKNTPTQKPSPTPTPQPIGSSENPLTIGFIVDPSNDVTQENSQTLVEQIGQITGYTTQKIEVQTPQELMVRMGKGEIHIAWLQPFTYINGKQKGFAKVLFIINHFGVSQYGIQFLANSSSGFISYNDPITGANTAGTDVALKQFQGKRPCWVDPTSASGYILPLGLLAENKIGVLEGVFSQSHSSIVRSLYITGICDFGATFAISGDPRTSSAVQQDLPDVLNKVQIIWRSDPMIPNLNLSIYSKLPKDIETKISEAFMDINKTSEGKQLLSDALNYNIDDLIVADDSAYSNLEKAIEVLGIDIKTLIGK